MTDSRVLDEDVMCQELEHRRTTQLDDRSQHGPRQPRWCLDGLTKSQKRRIQHLRQWEHQEEIEREALEKKKVCSQVW